MYVFVPYEDELSYFVSFCAHLHSLQKKKNTKSPQQYVIWKYVTGTKN